MVEEILASFQDGLLTRRECVTALVALITPDNVDTIMPALPQDFVSELKRWASQAPTSAGVVVGGNISSQEASTVASYVTWAITQKLRIARQAINDWIVQDRPLGISKK
jgi:hypothetical protein